jgi:septal ring factor EnvC (AmiA/AmiB activator)
MAPLLQGADDDLEERLHAHKTRVKRLRSSLQESGRQVRQIMAAIRDAGHSRALLDELQRLESLQSNMQIELTAAEASPPAPFELRPGELEKALAVLKDKLRGASADRATVLRGLVVEIRAERVGGSPIRHRKGNITGTIKLRLPLLDDEQIEDVSL